MRALCLAGTRGRVQFASAVRFVVRDQCGGASGMVRLGKLRGLHRLLPAALAALAAGALAATATATTLAVAATAFTLAASCYQQRRR